VSKEEPRIGNRALFRKGGLTPYYDHIIERARVEEKEKE